MQREIIDSHNDQFCRSYQKPSALVHQQDNLAMVSRLGKLRDAHAAIYNGRDFLTSCKQAHWRAAARGIGRGKVGLQGCSANPP